MAFVAFLDVASQLITIVINVIDTKYTCADPENFLRGGGGPNSQKGSDGKF